MKQPEDMKQHRIDRIEGDKVILNGQGVFPKRLIILDPHKVQEYRLVRSESGKYQLNK